MAAIRLDRVDKVFAAGQFALRQVTLEIGDGERVALVGPSGSGKSTILRLIAGLEAPTSGHVYIDGREVTDVPPERRDLAMVFQSYALYPHKTVRENLAFGLRVRRVPAAEIAARIGATADSLGLSALLDRLPAQLSGGQRQRVALGRAIVCQPQAFLFDEPLSNLDPRLRGDTRAELLDLHRRLAATMIYVTHDQEEAMTLGQRIVVLNAGVIEQIAAPGELYDRPASTFVAGFIGSPPMNLVSWDGLGEALGLERPRGAQVLGIRPHDITLGVGGRGIVATVDLVEPLGHAQIIRCRAGSDRLVVVGPPQPRRDVGQQVTLSFGAERVHAFDGGGRRVGPEAGAAAASPAALPRT